MNDKRSESLAALLLAGNIVKDFNIREAMKVSTKMSVPLEKALIMCGFASPTSLELPLQAQSMVDSGQISAKIAVDAMRLCCTQNGFMFDEAVAVCKELYIEKPIDLNAVGQLANLMASAAVINRDQLKQLSTRSTGNGLMSGQALRLNREISSSSLSAAINAQLMVQNRMITRDVAVSALKYAHEGAVSIEQALFELGLYKQPSGQEFKLSDLFAMAGLLRESDRLDCLEFRIVNRKPIGQIMVERGLAQKALVDTALQLQNAVSAGVIRPYQAAEALSKIARNSIPVEQAIAEVKAAAPAHSSEIRIGELLVKAGLCEQAAVDKVAIIDTPSNIKIGKLLLEAGLISEPALYAALRCQSLLKFGYVCEALAISLLQQATKDGSSLDHALVKLGKYVPSSMQWAWV